MGRNKTQILFDGQIPVPDQGEGGGEVLPLAGEIRTPIQKVRVVLNDDTISQKGSNITAGRTRS